MVNIVYTGKPDVHLSHEIAAYGPTPLRSLLKLCADMITTQFT